MAGNQQERRKCGRRFKSETIIDMYRKNINKRYLMKTT